jgi:transglutaminase/protease-like cytokinesis protein 3
MQIIFLIFLLVSPIRHVELLEIQINTNQKSIFKNYSNDNFKQILNINKNVIEIKTESSNYKQLDLNFRVIPNEAYIKKLSKGLKNAVYLVLNGAYTLNDYMINLSEYLKKNIEYSKESIPQTPESVVVNKKAHCVGFSNLTKVLLKSIGVESQIVQGFYLKKNKKTIIPIPHKWVEIELANGYLYFYDPQYQKFSSNYVVVNNSIIFSKVKKFKIKLIKYIKKMTN